MSDFTAGRYFEGWGSDRQLAASERSARSWRERSEGLERQLAQARLELITQRQDTEHWKATSAQLQAQLALALKEGDRQNIRREAAVRTVRDLRGHIADCLPGDAMGDREALRQRMAAHRVAAAEEAGFRVVQDEPFEIERT